MTHMTDDNILKMLPASDLTKHPNIEKWQENTEVYVVCDSTGNTRGPKNKINQGPPCGRRMTLTWAHKFKKVTVKVDSGATAKIYFRRLKTMWH